MDTAHSKPFSLAPFMTYVSNNEMQHYLNLLIKSIGKSEDDLAFVMLKEQLVGYTWVDSGDNHVLQANHDGVIFTFNANDILSKIEIVAPKQYFQLWVDTFLALKGTIQKAHAIGILGTPHATLNLQQKGEEQLLYNKVDYWLSLKCKNDELLSVSLLMPHLIPDSIKSNQVPIRTSHSKN
jgi:hypothetical protein